MKDKKDSSHNRSGSDAEKHSNSFDHPSSSGAHLSDSEEKKKKSSLPFFFRKKDRERSESTRSTTSESDDEKKPKKSSTLEKSKKSSSLERQKITQNQGRSSSFGGNESRKIVPIRSLDDDGSFNQALLNVDEHGSVHQQGVPRKESGWEAPSSWRVMTSPEKEVQSVRQSISEETEKQETDQPTKGRWVPPSSWNTPKDMRDIVDWNIRVTKRDHTFATITCSLDTTVAELRILLNKKFFIKKDDSYQFYLRKNGMEWHLDPDERPIYMEKHFFESLGYSDQDEMEQQGRKDHGYLFSFIYSDQPPNFGKPPRSIDGDYRTVNVNGLNLEALPLSVFKRANQIENLNMSRNPRVDFHLDFAELCTSLVSLKLSENEYLKVPKSVTLITTLQKLDLSRNYFDVIPPAIGKLVNITEFDVKCNYLSALPREMENMTNMTSLNLSNNLFEVCPFVIFSLVNLRTLDFSFCRLSTLQSQIEKLTKLTVLRLRGNQLTSLPPAIGSLPLVELDIRENKIADLSSIEKMSTIKKIFSESNVATTFAIGEKHSLVLNVYLSSNSITRFDVKCPTSNISILSLSKNKLLEFPDAFDRIPNIEQLDLDSNHISSLPASITSLKKLKSLTIADNDLNSLPEDIGKLTKLEYLNIRNNNLKSLPKEIWKLNSLVVLNASSNLLDKLPDFPQEGFKAELFDSLYELYLGDNNLGSGDPFPMITQFVELRILNLNYNFIVEVPATIKKLSKLLKLNLVGNLLSSIPDEVGDLRDLRHLFLSSNKLVTLPSEISKLTHLAVVDVSYNNLKYNTSNVQYEWDWNKNKELKLLDISGNQKLQFSTKPGSEDEVFQLPKLQVLCLHDMNEVPVSEKLEKQFLCRRTHEECNSGVADFLSQDSILMSRDMEKIFEDYRIYALFEGRNGASISGYLHRWLLYKLSVELKQFQSHHDCIRRTFLSLNKDMGLSNVAELDGDQAGCTATMALLKDRKLTIANVGDTQAIICRNGKAVPITQKHTTADKEEVQRVKKAGGFIGPNGKVNGVVDYTRAFGNFPLLPAINACPYVNEIDLQQDDQFLIIAGSPFWDHVGYQTAVDIARQEISSPVRAAHRLRDFAITYGVSNAFSVMVIPLTTSSATVAKTRVQKREVTDSTLARLEAEIDPPIGKIALVFTDIKNSTLLWETNPHAMRAAIKVHNAIMRRNLRNIGGYEVKTEGDAFMVSFKNAEDALKWCLTIQLELLEADWPQEILESPDGRETRGEDGKLLFRGLSIRMGIHVGEPVCEKDPVTGRMDYFGPPVNRAARVSATADGGQVVLSEEAYSDLHPKFGQFQVAFEPIVYDMGNINLKGLGAERIFMIIPSKLNGRIMYYKNLPSLQGIKAQDVKPEQLVRKSYIPKETFEDLERVCIQLEKLSATAHPPFSIPKPEAPSEEHLRALESLILRIENATSSLYMLKVGIYTEKIQKIFSTGSGNTPHFRKEDPTSLLRVLEYVLKASGGDLPL